MTQSNDNGSMVQLLERQASNRRVAKPWFDFGCGSASLRVFGKDT